VVCNNHVSALHSFRDIATFAMYASACVALGSPSVLIRPLKLQATWAFRFMIKHVIVSHISQGMGVTKVFDVRSGISAWCSATKL